MMLAQPLLEPGLRGELRRKQQYGTLCRVGVFLRVLTMFNALALILAGAYSAYCYGVPGGFLNSSLSIESRARAAVEMALMILSGLFLVWLEHASATNEAAARSALGLAFGPSGRFMLLVGLAVVSAPAVHADRTEIELCATGYAVGFLLSSALLQWWALSCAPRYRHVNVAELVAPKLQVDDSAFPQVYQRDEGAHLHVGVLLPGFASRETLTLSANCSTLTLVGDVSALESPYADAVSEANATNGPWGPFQRTVHLSHPVDVTTPVESRMGLGILEFKFTKGFEAA